MNREDYRAIAKENKTSIGVVKREMQNAINYAYIKPSFHANCIPRKGEVPTIDEFINYTSNRIKNIGGY